MMLMSTCDPAEPWLNSVFGLDETTRRPLMRVSVRFEPSPYRLVKLTPCPYDPCAPLGVTDPRTPGRLLIASATLVKFRSSTYCRSVTSVGATVS